MRINVILLSLIGLIYIVAATKSPGPLFMWSGKETFVTSKMQTGYTKSIAVEELLENIASISNKKGSLNKFLSKEAPFPEVIAIFLKPHLTNSKFSAWANVYDQKQKSGGSLANLRNLYENSKSSLSIHYSYLKDSFASDILKSFSEKLFKTYPKSSSVLFSQNKHDENHFPLHNMHWASISSAEEYLVSGDGKKYLHNGEPDLLIFYFSADEAKDTVTAEDSLIGAVCNIINIATNNNYLAMYSADVPEEHNYPLFKDDKEIVFFNSEYVNSIRDTTNSTDIAGTYFPPQIWQAIFVVFVLVFGFAVGISCTAYLQTPPKLLDEAMAKKHK